MAGKSHEPRSLAQTPTWSVATVLTIMVAVSLVVERSIHRLSSWLKKTHRNPLFEALEKMKEELMLLGFISLLLAATSRTISNICIDSKFYNSNFSPCSRSEVEDTVETENIPPRHHRELMALVNHLSLRRVLSGLSHNTCQEGHEPFVSYEGLEQLHRFIFVMAITHVSYSCLTLLLTIVKIHTWRKWEEEAHSDRHDSLAVATEVTRALTLRRQSTFVKLHTSNPWSRNRFSVWLNHNLTLRYDFHSYMIRSVEEEFKMIVGVRLVQVS